jgi:hypothetical protein
MRLLQRLPRTVKRRAVAAHAGSCRRGGGRAAEGALRLGAQARGGAAGPAAEGRRHVRLSAAVLPPPVAVLIARIAADVRVTSSRAQPGRAVPAMHASGCTG